jgi:hypothetical protein
MVIEEGGSEMASNTERRERDKCREFAKRRGWLLERSAEPSLPYVITNNQGEKLLFKNLGDLVAEVKILHSAKRMLTASRHNGGGDHVPPRQA